MHIACTIFSRVRNLLLILALLFPLEYVLAGQVAIVLSGDADPYKEAEAALRSKLAEAGQQVKTLQLNQLSEESLKDALGADVSAVAAVGTPAASFLHQNLPQATPLVYCMVANPAAANLDHDRPTWGVTTDVPLNSQFSLISEALPKTRVIGILCRTETPLGRSQVQMVKDALPPGWRVEAVNIDQQNLGDAINALMQKGPDFIWTTADSSIYDSSVVRALLLASVRAKIPVFGFSPAFVRAGAVLGVGVSPSDQGAQAGELLLKRISAPLNDNSPKVFAPSKYQIAVNLIVAEQLGVKVPDSVIRKSSYQFQPNR